MKNIPEKKERMNENIQQTTAQIRNNLIPTKQRLNFENKKNFTNGGSVTTGGNLNTVTQNTRN